jgi:hypothetical protein
MKFLKRNNEEKHKLCGQTGKKMRGVAILSEIYIFICGTVACSKIRVNVKFSLQIKKNRRGMIQYLKDAMTRRHKAFQKKE